LFKGGCDEPFPLTGRQSHKNVYVILRRGLRKDTVDSLLTHTPHNPYSPKTHTIS
jgi:hypothetical protein